MGNLKDWRWTSLTIGAPMGNLEGRLVYLRLSETVKCGSGNTAAVCMVALRGEFGGRATLLGNAKEGLETGVLLHRVPIGGPERGRCLPGTLREK